jgi:CheY-like chemotaxis protein
MIEYDELIKNINILLADDDEDYMMMTYTFLTQIGYNVDRANNGKEAIKLLKTNKYQIALLDYYMPEMNGEQVIEEIRKENKELIIILQTGFAGQKPPVETMKNLGIQNYHDKTEGIDRLNLELISAVKIFNQQNEIELTRFRANAIGNLISDVAQEIKASLLSISAGIEVTNLFVSQLTSDMDKEKMLNISKYYENNKASLEKVDKILSSIINQSTENTDYILYDKDVVELLQLILKNKSKITKVNVNIKAALKTSGFIKGSINDSIFIVAEIATKLMDIQPENSDLEIVLTDDENNWYFDVTSEQISSLQSSEKYLINRVTNAMPNTKMHEEGNSIIISLKK